MPSGTRGSLTIEVEVSASEESNYQLPSQPQTCKAGNPAPSPLTPVLPAASLQNGTSQGRRKTWHFPDGSPVAPVATPSTCSPGTPSWSRIFSPEISQASLSVPPSPYSTCSVQNPFQAVITPSSSAALMTPSSSAAFDMDLAPRPPTRTLEARRKTSSFPHGSPITPVATPSTCMPGTPSWSRVTSPEISQVSPSVPPSPYSTCSVQNPFRLNMLGADSCPLEADAEIELPDGFDFLGEDCKGADDEWAVFEEIRALCGYSSSRYAEAAVRLLQKVVKERTCSTAKSGSLMAFDGDLMVKSMSHEEAQTLALILPPYLEHLNDPLNRPEPGTGRDGSLLPRFLGAYVQQKDINLLGASFNVLGQTTIFVVMANVFGGVPEGTPIERFDLKGSSDGRHQRSHGAELMDFDLLGEDRKLVPTSPQQAEALQAQLRRDTDFLLAQQNPLSGVEEAAEAVAGQISRLRGKEGELRKPGLMDYSLLVGLAPRGTPGGVRRLDVKDVRYRAPGTGAVLAAGAHNAPSASASAHGPWSARTEPKTAFVGVIDILQFWTSKKRIARFCKKKLGMEYDDNGTYSKRILDTCSPAPYHDRFNRFMGEVFAEGSWLDSLPRLSEDGWNGVLLKQIKELPEMQQAIGLKAHERYAASAADEEDA